MPWKSTQISKRKSHVRSNGGDINYTCHSAILCLCDRFQEPEENHRNEDEGSNICLGKASPFRELLGFECLFTIVAYKLFWSDETFVE